MRLPHYLFRTRAGFTFQIIVPKPLRPLVGRARLRRALGPIPPSAAQWAALRLAARYAVAFRMVEAGTVTGDEDALKAGLAHLWGADSDRTHYKYKSPTGVEVETDGTESDHQQAMKMADADGTRWLELEKFKSQLDADDRALRLEGEVKQSRHDKAVLLWELRRLRRENMAKTVPVIMAAPPATALSCLHPGQTLGAAFDKWAPAEQARMKLRGQPAKSWSPKRLALEEFLTDQGPHTTVSSRQPSDLQTYANKLAERHQGSTAPSKLIYIQQFFKWCQKMGYYPEAARNPAEGLLSYDTKARVAAAERGAQPFEDSDLSKVFEPAAFSALDALNRWQVLLTLYTGSRSDEIAAIKLADIHHDPIPTVGWWFEVRKGKTAATPRKVPIHDELIAMGFPAWIEARRAEGAAHLFPELGHDELVNGPQQRVQKDFVEYLDRINVTAPTGTKNGIHRLRDTVIHVLDEAAVEQSWQERFVGHAVSGARNTQSSPHVVNYTSGKRLSKTQTTIHNLRAVCLTHLSFVAKEIINGKALADLMANTVMPKVERRKPGNPDHATRAAERAGRREAAARGETVPPSRRGPRPHSTAD